MPGCDVVTDRLGPNYLPPRFLPVISSPTLSHRPAFRVSPDLSIRLQYVKSTPGVGHIALGDMLGFGGLLEIGIPSLGAQEPALSAAITGGTSPLDFHAWGVPTCRSEQPIRGLMGAGSIALSWVRTAMLLAGSFTPPHQFQPPD
jgi:hypothetical protein